MVALISNPDSNFDRESSFTELRRKLSPRHPHLASHVVDLGKLDILLLDPGLHGREHKLWLVDGEVQNPLEMKGLRSVPKATFALQLEIIALRQQQRFLFGWSMLALFVLQEYNPAAIVSAIESFGRSHDAYTFAHYLAKKIGNPHDFDPRTSKAKSIEQYVGVLRRIRGRSMVISTKRQVVEYERFMSGEKF